MSKENLQRISDILHELDKRAAFALSKQHYDEALSIYEEILHAQQELKLEKFSGHTLLNIANILMIKKEYEKALQYIEEASLLRSLQKDYKDSGNIQICKANIFFEQNRIDEAEKLLTREIRRNRNNTICGQMELMLFGVYMQTDRKSKALTAVNNAMDYFKRDNNTDQLKRALSTRQAYFIAIGKEQYAKIDELELKRLS